MPQATSDGLRISYDDLGRGEPVLLFMHGWCANRTMWNPLARQRSSHRRTLAVDWRGHGRSDTPPHDFGTCELVEDALAVIEASGAHRLIPVTIAHAGWIAIELRRRFGERVPKIVLLDWIVLDPPPPFLAVLRAFQDSSRWKQARDQLFSLWLAGVDNAEVIRFVREDMGSTGFEMWARAGREIDIAYAQAGNPLRALASLVPPVPVLHLYAQPADPGYLAAQQAFSAAHSWFAARRLAAQSHFPMFEVPNEIAVAIEGFVT